MSESSSSSWRDDPLSVFLCVAAVVLAGMYLYESWQSRQMANQQRIAERLQEHEAFDGSDCRTGAAGEGGRQLVVRCRSLAASQIVSIADSGFGTTFDYADFDRYVFRGSDRQLDCTPPLDPSATTCSESPPPAASKAR